MVLLRWLAVLILVCLPLIIFNIDELKVYYTVITPWLSPVIPLTIFFAVPVEKYKIYITFILSIVCAFSFMLIFEAGDRLTDKASGESFGMLSAGLIVLLLGVGMSRSRAARNKAAAAKNKAATSHAEEVKQAIEDGGDNILQVEGEVLEFKVTTGELIGQDRHSETTVSGGATINGHSSGVSSYTTTTQDFWLRLDNGKELNIRLSNEDLVMRTGQRISVVYVRNKTSNGDYYYAIIANHASDTYRDLSPNFQSLGIPTGKSTFL
ncbi:MAG: hypothetical protein Q9M19_02930, partial [Mariprofundaceae bacterium]|nr:hypothetical protein [Mariprofundaceae bacterium]